MIFRFKNNIPPLFWIGGASFDMKPLLELYEKKMPVAVREKLSKNTIPVLTDYDKAIVEAMKKIYDGLDDTNFDLNNIAGRYWTSLSEIKDIEIKQMIPLSLFNEEDLKRIRHQYSNIFSHSLSVPDDLWHIVYISVEFHGIEFDLYYGLIENLTFWQEVIERFELNTEAFCALRVGGKSGNWDYTHNPKKGVLFDAIRNSKSIKPKIWIADECVELRKIWNEINPHERGFYGEMHFFETDWKNSMLPD